MSIVGGLSAQVGFGVETTPGTAVTPTRFFDFNDESIKFNRERIESKSLHPGRKTANLWVPGKQGGSGDVDFEVTPNAFGLIAKNMLGANATTQPNAGSNPTVYLHTSKVGTIDAQSLTTQFGRTGTSGTTDPYTYGGCKIDSWSLDMSAPDGLLMCKLGLDVTNETTLTALATASYAASDVLLPFNDANTSITIGGTSYNVGKVNISAANNLSKDRYRLGSSTKLEQVEANFREFTGTIDLESYQGTTPYNLFVNGTEAQIIATFSGANISGAYNYMVKVTLPRCRFDGETVNVGGDGLIPQSIPFKALWTSAATTEVQIETQNISTTA